MVGKVRRNVAIDTTGRTPPRDGSPVFNKGEIKKDCANRKHKIICSFCKIGGNEEITRLVGFWGYSQKCVRKMSKFWSTWEITQKKETWGKLS